MGAAHNSGVGNTGKSGGNTLSDFAPQINQSTPPSGTGLQQSQNFGKSQGPSNPMPQQLMAYQPPGQAQNTITSGQPIMGLPNQYMNTVAQNQQNPYQGFQNPTQQHGKGKG